MLVTILLPTRHRTSLVERTVRSLLDLANTPAQIEIAVAYDEDDVESHSYFTSTAWTNLVTGYGAALQIHKTPAWGYQELHKYYNLLADHAQGKWLLIWNDDALMKSAGWDIMVEQQQDYIGMLHMITENYRPKFALFPLIPRKWIDIFGLVSLSNSNDSWIHHICLEADAIKLIDAVVFHDRADLTGNNLDQTYLNRTNQKKLYKSESMRQLRHEWAQRLIEYRKQL
jgi:hypothetical protein